jgi:hypothetical protein
MTCPHCGRETWWLAWCKYTGDGGWWGKAALILMPPLFSSDPAHRLSVCLRCFGVVS